MFYVYAAIAGILGVFTFSIIGLFRKQVKLKETVSSNGEGHNKHTQEAPGEDDNKIKISLYFGSQTGTAEGFAKETAEVLKPLGFSPKIIDFEDFQPETFLEEKLIVIFCATYGEGDPPDNAIDFHAWLHNSSSDEEKLAEQSLKGMRYAVFGLGNRQYEHFNQMGRVINSKLSELGAEAMHEYGEGDDDADIEDDYQKWLEGFLRAMAKISGMNVGDVAESTKKDIGDEIEGRYVAQVVSAPTNPVLVQTEGRIDGRNISHEQLRAIELSSKAYFEGVPTKVIVNRELRKSRGEDGLGSTIHLEFELKGTGLTYETADNLAICPENDPELVKQAATFLGFDLDMWFHLEPVEDDTAPLFPTPCTVRTAFTCYVSLNHVPSRYTLHKLADFAKSEEHQKRLRYLASREGKREYTKKIVGNRYDLVDVFEMFPSIVNPPLGPFLDALPRLQPRYYTISSSSKLHPTRIHVTASVVREKKNGIPEGRMFNGVCTTFLDRLHPREGKQTGKRAKSERGVPAAWPQAYVFLRPSSFKLPEDPSVPIILIGPGTGIAPMRAFIQEKQLQNPAKRGDVILFFGCRRENEDFIYEDEIEMAVKEGILTKLFVAFSREQAEKVYVQHLIAREAELVWDYIANRNASIYVCGGTEMGKDVHHTLETLIVERGALTASEAKEYLESLSKSKRYIQELWSS